MAVTKYPYAAGKDPTYDAWKAKADYERQNAWYDAAQGQRKATEDYRNALAQLAQQQKVGTREIDNSMLARGVFSSGETSRRQGEFGAQILGARSAADAAKAETFGRISTDLQRALTSMDLNNESQVQAALARMRKGSGAGGGGGGGGKQTTTFGGNNAGAMMASNAWGAMSILLGGSVPPPPKPAAPYQSSMSGSWGRPAVRPVRRPGGGGRPVGVM